MSRAAAEGVTETLRLYRRLENVSATFMAEYPWDWHFFLRSG